MTGGEVGELRQALDEAMQKLGVPAEALVRCCYEAGRDGFWLHRLLEDWGVENVVVDPASIEVSRQARRTEAVRGGSAVAAVEAAPVPRGRIRVGRW